MKTDKERLEAAIAEAKELMEAIKEAHARGNESGPLDDEQIEKCNQIMGEFPRDE